MMTGWLETEPSREAWFGALLPPPTFSTWGILPPRRQWLETAVTVRTRGDLSAPGN